MKFFYLSWNSMEQYVHLNVEQAVLLKKIIENSMIIFIV